jgi:hypothetical protein
VEALDLPIGLRPVGLGGDVLDLSGGKQLAQRAVLDVAKALSVISRLASIPWEAKKASDRSTKAVTVAARSSGWSST